MNRTVEIYFDDLTPEAQKRLMTKFETTAGQENWDTVPLAVIEREVEDKVTLNLCRYNDKRLSRGITKWEFAGPGEISDSLSESH